MHTIKIGLIHSLTGAMSFSAPPLLDAELLAIEEINNTGGVMNCFIEPVIEDGASDPMVFAEKAEKLITQDQVKIIFGGWNSRARKAVKAVVEKYNALFWFPLAYEGLEESDNVFYTGCCLNQQIIPAIDWCCEQGWERFYLLGLDYIYPVTANKLIEATLFHRNKKVVKENYISLENTDFREVIEDIRETKPDVIINTMNGGCNLHFFNQLHRAGYSASQLPVLSTSIAEHEFKTIGQPTLGHYACWSYFQCLDNQPNLDFVKKFKNKYGEDSVVGDPVVMSYTQIFMWKKIAEKARSFSVDEITKQAIGMVFDTPFGQVEMKSNHHLTKKIYIGKAKRGGEFKIVWQTPKYVEPLPWGIEHLNVPFFYFIKNVLSKFSDIINFNTKLEQKVKERTKEFQMANEEYETINEELCQKNAEYFILNTKLEESEQRFKSAFFYAGIGMALVSLEGKWLKVNEALPNILGYSEEELLNLTFQDISYPDDLSTDLEYVKDLIEGKSSDYTMEKRYYHKDGHVIWAQLNVSILRDDNNKPLYFISQIQDISDRIKAQAGLKEKNEKYEIINERLKKHQYELEFLVRERTDKLQTMNKELEAINESLMEKSRLIDNRNIELKQTLQKLQDTQGKLVQAEKMASMGVLTAGVAHEINNPLNFIKGGYIGLERYFKETDQLDNSKVLYLINSIKMGVDRAVKIVKSLNQFSRNQDSFDEQCDIHSILNNCLIMLNNQLKHRVEIHKHYTKEPIFIYGNVGKLHQVFINLLGNASQAMENSGEMELFTYREKNEVIIEISDTGCGISADNLTRITDPFFTTKAPGKGSGLGLSITYNIIREHEGNLEFFSEIGKGTTAKVTLPMNRIKPLEYETKTKNSLC